MLERLTSVCRDDCQLQPDALILAAVSGGPDSLCLLDVLRRLGYPLVVAHYDHSLRAESAADAAAVQSLAESFSLPFVTERGDVPGLAAREKLSIEEAARLARYRFLFAQARALGVQAVAVGHTADDQVETVLMHLLRGSGLSGLKGMTHRVFLPAWDEQIPLVRPLLGVWRSEVEDYCANRGLAPLEDASNRNTTYFRNRLRHELIPTLREYNPQVKEVLWRTAQVLSADYALVEQAAGLAWQACLVGQGPGFVSLSLSAFRRLETALRRAVLRRAVACLRPALRDLDFEAVERGAAFALNPPATRRMDFIQRLNLSVEGDLLTLAEWGVEPPVEDYPQIEPGRQLILPVPGEVALDSGWILRAEITDPPAPGEHGGSEHAWLAAAALVDSLQVRTPRPGDRFQPFGMEGRSVKLSDFWINQHLPRSARAGWPLVFSGETLAWVPLYRPAHPFRLQSPGERCVHLWVERSA